LRVSITPYQSAEKCSIETGVCLSSGSPDTGSTTGLVSAADARIGSVGAIPVMGANTMPGGTSEPVRTRATIDPHIRAQRRERAVAHREAQCVRPY
jgi:hypothetical protein